MLRWISIFGGLLIMMGYHARSEALFYYFRVEDQVPENHLLRLIDRYINFDFVREQLKDSYSETGRPSIDPYYDNYRSVTGLAVFGSALWALLSIGRSRLSLSIGRWAIAVSGTVQRARLRSAYKPVR